jgi:hypothetical protein
MAMKADLQVQHLLDFFCCTNPSGSFGRGMWRCGLSGPHPVVVAVHRMRMSFMFEETTCV